MPGGIVGTSMSYGNPGTYSRTDSAVIKSRTLDPISPSFCFFGDAIFQFYNSSQPGGVYRNVAGLSASFSGISHTSTTIDGLVSTSTIFNSFPAQVGMLVIGPGCPYGCQVASVGANSITLTLATTTSVASTFNLVSPVVTYNGFCGVALREVLTQRAYFAGSNIAYYSPGAQVDCLERGTCSVQTQVSTGMQPWGTVWLRIAVNPAASFLPVGGYESQPDGNYTINLPAQWGEGLVDSSGVAEIVITNRTNA